MQNTKPFSFKASAGDFFIFSIASIILVYIPIFGWAFLFNYAAKWMADRATVNDQKITYQAGYGETLKFIFINMLLVAITFGIYSFWFYPKAYAYIADHLSFGGPVPVTTTGLPRDVAAMQPAQPVQPPTFIQPAEPLRPAQPNLGDSTPQLPLDQQVPPSNIVQ